MTETWNSASADEMASIVSRSGMSLDSDDRRLVERHSDPEAIASVYDLHRLNVLCHQAVGYRRGLREGVELAKDLLRDDPPDCYWRDVDAELERRLK